MSQRGIHMKNDTYKLAQIVLINGFQGIYLDLGNIHDCRCMDLIRR